MLPYLWDGVDAVFQKLVLNYLQLVNSISDLNNNLTIFHLSVFQLICSYVFMPITYLMGVEWKDAGVVGELVGIKTFLNEFVAYKELAKYISNREECLQGTVLSVSEFVIVTNFRFSQSSRSVAQNKTSYIKF